MAAREVLGNAGVVLRDLTDLIWPLQCPGCGQAGATGGPACPECLAVLTATPLPTAPRPPPPGLPPLWAVTAYDGVARALLLAHKEQGARRLARPLGRALGAALGAAIAAGGADGTAGECAVVPVPSSRAARRARGDDPTRRLARIAVATLRQRGVRARLVPALHQRRAVADQAGLTAVGRAANLDGALGVAAAARPVLSRAGLLVVADDVVTTGATLAEATRALAGSGTVVGAGIIAATQRRGGEGGPDRPAPRSRPEPLSAPRTRRLA